MSRIAANPLDIVVGKPRCSPPCAFVLIGATGDLAARKIIPALYNLWKERQVSGRFVVLGVGRRPMTDEQFRRSALDALREHSRSRPVDEELWSALAAQWFYYKVQSQDAEGYRGLAQRLAGLERQYGTGGSRLFHLAMPPETYGSVFRGLGRAGLAQPGGAGAFVRLVVEKPFGGDLHSAEKLNAILAEHFDESQVYRIDHYLGKETVQNLLVFRFANAIFEPLLSGRYVDRVEITTAETVGMEGRRGAYYDAAGALRDMVQNHMFQLLALTAMEPPARLNAEAIRDEKVRVLQALRSPMGEEAARTVRGQYGAAAEGPAYRQEGGVAPDSRTETYVALKVFVDCPRWAGVPFYLRTGKRLAAKASGIVVVFKREAVRLFSGPECDVRGPNRLEIRVFPDEGIHLVFDAKVPGPAMLLRPVRMSFRYGSEFSSASPEAYEHLLLDAICGDPTLFIRRDEVEASWRFIDAVRREWDRPDAPPVIPYRPGSWGPQEADGLFGDPYTRWQPL